MSISSDDAAEIISRLNLEIISRLKLASYAEIGPNGPTGYSLIKLDDVELVVKDQQRGVQMTFQFLGAIYRLIFRHDKPYQSHMCETCGQNVKRPRRQTICVIRVKDGNEWPTLATGVGHCHPRDNWSKEGGRKASLTSALRNLDYIVGRTTDPDYYLVAYKNRQGFHKAAWDAYLNRVTITPKAREAGDAT
jgi:hypothetical protein